MAAIMRQYHRTHHWITFQFNFNKLSPEIWLRLGRIQSKCEHVAEIPLLPAVADHFHNINLIKGVQATTAIEGNTLTEDEIREIYERSSDFLPASKSYQAKEVENVISAVNLIANDLLQNETTRLEPEKIKQYNQMILDGLPLGDEVIPGEYRHHEVRVAGYKGAPPEDLPLLMSELCDWLNGWEVDQYLEVPAGILKAIVAHVYIAWIHPFGDGNGRTARLIEFQLLLALGFPTNVVHLLSNHYNETRTEYYRYLDLTSKREDGIYMFIDYALQGLMDRLDEQIRMIEAQQLIVHWESYIHASFRNKNTETDHRRRRLLLDISRKGVPIPIAEIRHVSPRIAEAYATKTDRTVQRDINKLIEMELLSRTADGTHVRARTETMLAFMPQKRR